MKNRTIRLAAIGLMIPLLIIPGKADEGFYDVDDHAAYAQAVEYVSEAGIMTGSVGGEFNPMGTVTRAQMAAIVCRVIEPDGEKPSGKAPFPDVSSSYWAGGYIQKAVSLGIISGFGDGTFRPESTLNFNQGIAMLIRSVGLKEAAEKAGGYPNGYLAVARQYNFLTGINSINSQRTSNLKRYEIAMMIYNYYKKDNGLAGETSHISKSSLADGEYSMRISLKGIGTDGAGNETVHSEILDAVVFNDSYVKSLKIGDKISLGEYGLDNEIIVTESIKEPKDGIYINDYTYLWRYGQGWMIFEDELPVEYVAGEIDLVFSSSTAIIDGYTSAQMGNPKDLRLGSLREFFENPLAGAGERRVIVTITGGNVVKVYIPYTPM